MVGIKGKTGVKPPDVVKRQMIKVRLNDAQMQAIREKADDTGVSVSVVVRALINNADIQGLKINDKSR